MTTVRSINRTPEQIMDNVAHIDPEAEFRRAVAARAEDVWRATQLRLLETEKKLAALGINMDDLIELIEARQSGSY